MGLQLNIAPKGPSNFQVDYPQVARSQRQRGDPDPLRGIINCVPSVEVLGVHPVDAPEPCHLVEVLIRGSTGPVDLGKFTQDAAPLARSDWQVAYDEHMIVGGSPVSLWRSVPSEAWLGDIRLAFFLHHVDVGRPLRTPFGESSYDLSLLCRRTPRASTTSNREAQSRQALTAFVRRAG